MKQFADLHLRIPIDNLPQAEKMICKALELGYDLVGIPFPSYVNREKISEIEKICKDIGLDFATRVNLSPRNSNQLLHDLRKIRRKFEIVAVRCLTKDTARHAAKDRRVDLLQFSVTNMRQRFFDEQEAELASQALSSLEIELSPLLQLTRFSRVRLLSILRREAATAERVKVPIILSSGATEAQLMRGAYDYASLGTLFDLTLASSFRALSENPVAMVERNREKLNPDFVAPGIRIAGRKICD
jgi:RNase P/RNase MRP subunit p30